MNTLPMGFPEFIQVYYPHFKIDEQSHPLVKRLHYYAVGDERFTKSMPTHWTWSIGGGTVQPTLSLRKGILLFGNVGSGKSELLYMLQNYLRYLRHPHAFKTRVVWEFAREFSKGKQEVYESLKRGHLLLDELCLTDGSGEPKKEVGQYMGSWTQAGEECIWHRREYAAAAGYVTHFTTNIGPEELFDIYGSRNFSRLAQMCNFIPLIGADRRLSEDPVARADFQYVPVAPTVLAQVTEEEEAARQEDSRVALDRKLVQYRDTGADGIFSAADYNILKAHKAIPFDETALRSAFFEPAIALRKEKLATLFDKDSRQRQKQHRDRKFDTDEQGEIMLIAKKLALVTWAQNLLKDGKETFFKK